LTQAVRESYDQLCATVAAASKLPIADPRVSVRAIHALALVHGLSNLQLDGELADWVGDPETVIESVLEYAAELRASRKPG
jgi:hypothetical protein